MAVNKIMSAASWLIGKGEKSRPVQWAERKFNRIPEKALGVSAVLSIVAKDGIGCYKYVTQSLHNDKIPDEKRKFVAALDLTNGLLMILAQIGMYMLMRKYSAPLFKKLFKNSFNPETAKNIASKVRMKQKQEHLPMIRKSDFENEFKEVENKGLSVFKFVVDIAAATIIGKRVIVPFIATPLAAQVKKKMDVYEQNHNPQKAAKNDQADNQPVPEAFGDKLDISTHDTNLLKRYYNYHK